MTKDTTTNQSIKADDLPLFEECNPTNSLLIKQFLQTLEENKIGSAIKMLQDGEIVLLEKAQFDKITEVIQQKDADIDLWESEFNKIEMARQLLQEEITVLFTSFKQVTQLFDSVQPVVNMFNKIVDEGISMGISVDNPVRLGLFYAKKIPIMMKILKDEALREKLKEEVSKIDWICPLQIMVKNGLIKEEFLERFKQHQALPPASNPDLLNSNPIKDTV